MYILKGLKEPYVSPLTEWKELEGSFVLCASDNSTGSNEKYNNWDYEW